jgi:hypothetical protein
METPTVEDRVVNNCICNFYETWTDKPTVGTVRPSSVLNVHAGGVVAFLSIGTSSATNKLTCRRWGAARFPGVLTYRLNVLSKTVRGAISLNSCFSS